MEQGKLLPIDYVTKDYDGFFQMMKEQIPNLTPEWTDLSESDQGIVILQALSYGLHILGYYQDKAVQENLLPLAKTKKAILALCKFLGYTPPKQRASVCVVTFTKNDYALDSDVVIPKGTKVSTNQQAGEPVIYETTTTLLIPAGTLSASVDVEQGETVYQEIVGKGNNQADQTYRLDYPEVLEDTLEVITRENNRDYYWTLVNNLFDSTPEDRHFMTSMDEEGYTWVIFGDGSTGMRVGTDVNIYAHYRHGGGTVGDMPAGTITELYETTIQDVASVTNPKAATGGADYESLEKSRALAPRLYRSADRIVTPSDCEDFAVAMPGIARAKVIESFDANNLVKLYVAGETGISVNAAQQTAIREALQPKLMFNQRLTVESAAERLFDLDVDIITYDNFVNADVQADVEDALRTHFAGFPYDFGEKVFISQIVRVCFGVAGVRNAVIKQPLADIALTETELPKIQTLTVTVTGGVM